MISIRGELQNVVYELQTRLSCITIQHKGRGNRGNPVIELGCGNGLLCRLSVVDEEGNVLGSKHKWKSPWGGPGSEPRSGYYIGLLAGYQGCSTGYQGFANTVGAASPGGPSGSISTSIASGSQGLGTGRGSGLGPRDGCDPSSLVQGEPYKRGSRLGTLVRTARRTVPPLVPTWLGTYP